ncbi:hypothetical protein R1flu_021184 [Riccia fluitans]|uniref:Uncharacterized protein n=1 Tax=Riccia fluitans TaxID=41844 RepID=A0ABD1ZNN5_9MARC
MSSLLLSILTGDFLFPSDSQVATFVPTQQLEAKTRTKTMMHADGDRGYGEGTSTRPPVETPVPKPRRKRGAAGEEGDAKRRRKPKPTVEVDSTFTELKRLVQEMRPSTIQVLRTPFYRNCKAARNMRKGVRQIRDFCKQIRLETVLLSKKKLGEEATKRRRKKPEASPAGGGAPTGNLDLEGPSLSHSPEQPAHSNEKKMATLIPREAREPSESSEAPKPRLPVIKPDTSPPDRDWDMEVTPKREKDREREKSPRREREREKSKIEDEELTKEDSEESD